MLTYPARLEPTDDGKVRLILPDVPEVEILAATEDAALGGAAEALESALSFYVVDARAIPAPSDICGAPMVETAKFSLTGLEIPASG